MLFFLLSDHLGSTSLTTNANGDIVAELRYKAWGEVRFGSGNTPTQYTYTGQYSHTADFGLMFYNARWYDPALSRFDQADSIVSGGVQGLDRYAYANNSPVKYSDPSGHRVCDDVDANGNCITAPGGPAGGIGGGGRRIEDSRLTTFPDDCDIMSYRGYCYTGDQMVELYNWYMSHSGQWNNYGQQGFTVEDFLAWIILMELGYTLGDTSAVAIAKQQAAEKMMWLCGYVMNSTCTGVGNNAAFNYIATRASAGKRYTILFNKGDPDPVQTHAEEEFFYPGYYPVAKEIASYAMGYTGLGSMADWANRSYFTNPQTIEALNVATVGTKPNQIWYIWQDPYDPLYFFTQDQINYWHCHNAGNCK